MITALSFFIGLALGALGHWLWIRAKLQDAAIHQRTLERLIRGDLTL